MGVNWGQIYSSEISSWEYPYVLDFNGKDLNLYSR